MRKIILVSIFLVLITLLFVSVFFVSKQYNTDVQEEVLSTESALDTEIGVQEKSQPEIKKEEKVALVSDAVSQEVLKKEENVMVKDVVQLEKLQIITGLPLLDRQTILLSHNNERNIAGVVPLAWSPTLALQAQKWADSLSKSCVPSHASVSVRNGKGENIWAGYGYGVWSVSEMVSGWILEKQNYIYNTNTCAPGAMCGHYTQVVWNETTEIGCGITSCSEGGEQGKIFVCRYSPAGNVPNKKPY